MSLDGFVADQSGKNDWIFSIDEEDCIKYANNLIDSVDLILLGRVLSKEFLDYWPTDFTELGQKINRLPKIIFSKTLKAVDWPNVKIINENIAEEIALLKDQPGKNIILYGGVGMAQTFMNLDLIDEYHFMVVPVVLANGLPLFGNIHKTQKLKL
jgi:dihydrofolate reductase